jgi:hypothetical protein
MPTLPVNSQHDIVLQDPNTGAVDYLQFSGTTLTRSNMIDYGIAGFGIAAAGDFNGDGHQDLLAQNATTGQLDFLNLDANGHLIASATNSTFVGTVHGAGSFGAFAGQVGPVVVSQLADGTIDLLGYNGHGALVGSQTIAGTAGLPPIVGVGESFANFPLFQGNGTGTNDNIIVQYADGTIDALGFSGSVGVNGGVTFTNSFVIPNSAGSGHVIAVNQDFGGNTNESIPGAVGNETVQFVTQAADGHITSLFANSGYGGATFHATEGQIFAQDALAQAFPGLNVVDGGKVPHTSFFPIT